MDYGALTRRLVAQAIGQNIPGLTIKIDFMFLLSDGAYDPETDTMGETYNEITDLTVTAVSPTMEDVTNYGITGKSKKLLVPGAAVPQEPRSDVDKVRIGDKLWNIAKVVGVPGDSLYIVFVKET